MNILIRRFWVVVIMAGLAYTVAVAAPCVGRLFNLSVWRSGWEGPGLLVSNIGFAAGLGLLFWALALLDRKPAVIRRRFRTLHHLTKAEILVLALAIAPCAMAADPPSPPTEHRPPGWQLAVLAAAASTAVVPTLTHWWRARKR